MHLVGRSTQCNVPAFQRGVRALGRGIFVSKNCQSNGSRHNDLPMIRSCGGAREHSATLHHHPKGALNAETRRLANEGN